MRTPFSRCTSPWSPGSNCLTQQPLCSRLHPYIAAMLLQAVRSSCLRPARYASPIWPNLIGTRPGGSQHRRFTAATALRNKPSDTKTPKNEKKDGSPVSIPALTPIASASGALKAEGSKPNDTPKKELLSESAKANKEQRKADWAIMREMAKYLWPKVRRIDLCFLGVS